MHIKKQNTQLRQLEAAAKDAEQTAETAQQQYKEHLRTLQSQVEQAGHQTVTPTDKTQLSSAAQADSSLRAELQSLTQQLAGAQQKIVTMQQQQADAGYASVLPSSNASTPSKPVAASPGRDSAVQDSAAQDSSAASSEKDSAKDKDAQLQVWVHVDLQLNLLFFCNLLPQQLICSSRH